MGSSFSNPGPRNPPLPAVAATLPAFAYRGEESSRRFFPRQAPFFSRLSAGSTMRLGLDPSPSSDNGRSWMRSCLHRAELPAFCR